MSTLEAWCNLQCMQLSEVLKHLPSTISVLIDPIMMYINIHTELKPCLTRQINLEEPSYIAMFMESFYDLESETENADLGETSA